MLEFHHYFLYGSGINHFVKSLKNKMLVHNVCLQFLVKQICLVKRLPICLHYMYTPTHAGLELIKYGLQ
jgi:hypothetical protein